jgi:hypothetical protein
METENAAAAAAAAFTASSQLKEAVLGRKPYWLERCIRWEACLLPTLGCRDWTVQKLR